jgi:hypothetical protein
MAKKQTWQGQTLQLILPIFHNRKKTVLCRLTTGVNVLKLFSFDKLEYLSYYLSTADNPALIVRFGQQS